MRHLNITAGNGVPFHVIAFEAGEHKHYKRHPIIEFWDTRTDVPDAEFGLLAASFRRTDFLAVGPNAGLNLRIGSPSWQLDVTTYQRVRMWFVAAYLGADDHLHAEGIPYYVGAARADATCVVTGAPVLAGAECYVQAYGLADDYVISRYAGHDILTAKTQKCQTIGCASAATRTIEYGAPGERVREGVCDDCAGSYVRRSVLHATDVTCEV